MLKTAFGKAIVGAVALSGVATHALDFVQGGTFDFQGIARTDVTREGWAKLPHQGRDFGVVGHLGVIINPAYTGGVKVAVQGFGSGFVSPQTEAAISTEANKDEGDAAVKVETKGFGVDQYLTGVVSKIHLYSFSESLSVFGQVGYGWMLHRGDAKAKVHGVVGGVGLNYHIDGGFNWTLDYKHLAPIFGDTDTITHFATVSTGLKYNWV
jgi:hypothetical protein